MTLRLMLTVLCFVAVATQTLGQPSRVNGEESDSAREASAGEIEEVAIEPFDRDHWSFRPIGKPAVPEVQDETWSRTAIDHFLLARMREHSLTPAPEADRRTLIRRLSFDVTGLPPTVAEVDAFLSDSRPGAYTQLVDAYLASPHYGQRWAQYWLDLARFAETDGFEHDKIRPQAWRYRDWVIDALNADMPYDQFVRWQIAGDVVAPPHRRDEGKIATAFCLSGPDMPDINSQEERKHVLMNEVTSTIGAVFFSLQMGCAQCHDHKYDAISQADFYRLRAFFDASVSLRKNQSVNTLQPAADADARSYLMVRGDWRRKGAAVEAAFPRIANPEGTHVTSGDPGQRRAQLAEWLTSADQPLTARTIVNRIWQHHFGRGFSSTPSDFGVMGDEPSHPELLDFLASRLIDQGWSLKKLHREILLSSVYRMRSLPTGEAEAQERWRASVDADPANRWWSRFPRRRLDAESIRDAMFAVSGSLNREWGGPGVQPPLPPEMIRTLKSGQWKTSKREADHYRQSIYIFARRNLRYPFFAMFDRPAANDSCAARQPSTTAVQSLMLFNSSATIEAARRLAANVSQESAAGDLRGPCRRIYLRLFSRPPDAGELDDCLAFLDHQEQMLREEERENPRSEAVVDLCRALLNSSQFIYVD